jgi:hypothetical protein
VRFQTGAQFGGGHQVPLRAQEGDGISILEVDSGLAIDASKKRLFRENQRKRFKIVVFFNKFAIKSIPEEDSCSIIVGSTSSDQKVTLSAKLQYLRM